MAGPASAIDGALHSIGQAAALFFSWIARSNRPPQNPANPARRQMELAALQGGRQRLFTGVCSR